ncbi:hypothetical protein [Paradevosia shaoguanensis]|uniref:hypothetical protein n=1 Tax=Paradevosia shaoguanensis TaxID=1335043 RepID=UPI0019344C83|nr:hypothetical protein [Paradevosia shaoguanensis]
MFLLATAIAALSLSLAPSFALAQEGGQFAEATETVPELIDLYEAADSECRLNPSPDVKVVVACVSRSIYGAALNERNWCIGREGEPNAMMEWHECEADSLRFPPVDFDG